MIVHLDFETYSHAGTKFDLESRKWISPIEEKTSVRKKGLPLIGAHAYAEHPSTDILVAQYAFRSPGSTCSSTNRVIRWIPGDEPPWDLFAHVSNGGCVHAFNSFFEWCIWNQVCVRRYNWPPLPIQQTRDTAAKARAWSLPGSLDGVTSVLFRGVSDEYKKVLGVTEKDKDGAAVMKRLSQPRNPSKKDPRLRYQRTGPDDNTLWDRLDEYCADDVRAEISVDRYAPTISEKEQHTWLIDQLINARGVNIDIELVDACLSIIETAKTVYGLDLALTTNGAITAVSQATAILNWVRDTTGRELKTLEVDANDGLNSFLTTYRRSLPSEVIKVLEIRRDVGGSAPSKLIGMKYRRSLDGRLRGNYIYCGAPRTKRWSGSGVQLHNLPRGGGVDLLRCNACGGLLSGTETTPCSCGGALEPIPWDHNAVEAVLPFLRSGNFEMVRSLGSPAKLIAGCIRAMIIPAPQCEFISSDYSAIESVVLACMAGEQWVIEVYQTDGKLYERTASKITGIPLDTILQHKIDTGRHHTARSVGKVGALASQYRGARAAWLEFGAGAFMTNREIDEGVKNWRASVPNIVEYWYRVEAAVVDAIQRPGENYPVLRMDNTHTGVTAQKSGSVLYIYLPNGEWLAYHNARLESRKKLSSDGWQVMKLCDNIAAGEDDSGLLYDELRELLGNHPALLDRIVKLKFDVSDMIPRLITGGFFAWKDTIVYEGYQGGRWQTIETHGGKLVGNITQSTARFILAEAMPRIEAAGYPLVLHTHDELVSEVPAGYGSIEEYEQLMSIMPNWAVLPDGKPWPIKAAGGWRGKTYRK